MNLLFFLLGLIPGIALFLYQRRRMQRAAIDLIINTNKLVREETDKAYKAAYTRGVLDARDKMKELLEIADQFPVKKDQGVGGTDAGKTL